MHEHRRIATYFAPLAASEPGSLDLTDDAAVLVPPAHKKLVATTDSVIRGVHVPATATAAQMAHKLARRNLSDLAAMGATPWRYLLNLHAGATTTDVWFAEFAAALDEEQKRFGMVLVGGDTTSGKGPLSATMTLLGLLDDASLTRRGAREGDALYVSGTIGDAALGLHLLQRKLKVERTERRYLTQRYYLPEPRLTLGKKLIGIASAALDCSDGLLADAGHLAHANRCGIMIERDAIPLSPAARRCVNEDSALWESIVSGGDDYELIFTAPWSAKARVEKLAAELKLPLTRIGSVVKGSDITLRDAQGAIVPVSHTGWEH